MSEAALVSSAAGDLYIINRPARLAWQVSGYFYPGAALKSLLQAAAGQPPQYVGRRHPAPEALELPDGQLQTIARLQDGQYRIDLNAVTKETCTFLGVPRPESSPQPQQTTLTAVSG